MRGKVMIELLLLGKKDGKRHCSVCGVKIKGLSKNKTGLCLRCRARRQGYKNRKTKKAGMLASLERLFSLR